MNRILAREQMEASLRRAGRGAVSSTREGQAGQFAADPLDIAMRMRNEMRIATLNWATVEAFNNRFETFRDDLIKREAWQPALFGVRALVRDVIITLFRVPGDDLQTICAVVALFDGMSAAEVAKDTGATEIEVTQGLQFISNRVPSRWGKNEPAPNCSDLAELRLALRPVRDGLIAHAKTYSSLDVRSAVPKARSLLQITCELSDAACMICNVPRDDLQERWSNSLEQAEKFWAIVEAGSRSLVD